jgi:hypothetical protein
MKAFWRLVEEDPDYPHIVVIGCWAHILQLFLSGKLQEQCTVEGGRWYVIVCAKNSVR